MNVWLSDELAAVVRDRLPEVNYSAVLSEGLRSRLKCRHELMACTTCGQVDRRHELEDQAVGRFYLDVVDELRTLVNRGGTAEGAARVFKSIAERHHVTVASKLPLPRPTRAERHAYKVREFPLERRA